ncbi:hypothetical protein IAU60_003847 [Kwoniella sp. DSM 27419]
MAAPGTQSPSSQKPDPMVPTGGPQLTQAEQRPAAGSDAPKAPGEESKGPSAEAIKTAQQSADNISGEQGQSRKDVEASS